MSRRILLLDAGLVVLLVLGGIRLRSDWKAFGPVHNVASIQPRAQSYPPLPVGVAATGEAADWTEIPVRNPFSFDRSDIDIVVEAATPVVEPPKPLGPKPVLFGTIFLDRDHHSALVAPGPSGRNYREMKVGDKVDGWTILEVERKSIVIESQGVRQTVIMNDPTAQIPRETVRTEVSAAPAVIQSGQVLSTAATSTPAAPTGPAASAPTPPPASREGGPTTAQELFGGRKP